ncbi:MAG TPA: cation:proton antiporter, partial [Firmicutes bacterium]|nr:cation:proton antiporter [Bacillota bacterium]
MKELFGKLIMNYPYFAAAILFMIGALTVLTRSDLLKKLIGINIMESAIFLIFVAGGNIRGGVAPLLSKA